MTDSLSLSCLSSSHRAAGDQLCHNGVLYRTMTLLLESPRCVYAPACEGQRSAAWVALASVVRSRDSWTPGVYCEGRVATREAGTGTMRRRGRWSGAWRVAV